MKPYAIVAPLYDAQGGGSEFESAHTLNILREELARMPEPPILIDLFGLRRPPRSAHREADATRWIAATPQPLVSLRQPLPVPPGETPETPEKPKDKDSKKAEIAIGAIAASAPFWIWLWRKIRRKK